MESLVVALCKVLPGAITLAEAWLLPIDVTIGILAIHADQMQAAGAGGGDSEPQMSEGPGGTRRYKFGSGAAGLEGLKSALRTGRV